MMLSRQHAERLPDEPSYGLSAFQTDTDSDERMILLDLSSLATADDVNRLETIFIEAPELNPPMLTSVLDLEQALAPPVIESESDEPQIATNQRPEDASARAAQFGRYVGQISARIERAWIRPRSPIGAGGFE
jgi:hypothetical protein